MSKEIKTFEVDTWILFDRDSFNLKGYRYKFCEDKKDLLEIYDQDLPKLKEELSDYLFEWATDGSSKDSLIPFVYFSEDDFQDTYNPFKGETWNEYYADLDMPNEWVNVSYGNDELPSFISQKDIHKAYHIWINSFNEKVRKENHDLDFGNELAPRFNITLCYGSGYDLLSTNSFDEVIKWIKENPKTKQQIKETKEIV